MGTTYRSTLVNLLSESARQICEQYIGPFVTLHVIHSPVPLCCLLSHTGTARSLISESSAGHQFSIQIMHMHCTHVPLPLWNSFPLPKIPMPFQCLPFMKCRGPVLLCSCWTHCTCLQLLHMWEFTATSYTSWSLVLWHSFILKFKFNIRLGDGKMMLPIALVWHLHIKSSSE